MNKNPGEEMILFTLYRWYVNVWRVLHTKSVHLGCEINQLGSRELSELWLDSGEITCAKVAWENMVWGFELQSQFRELPMTF